MTEKKESHQPQVDSKKKSSGNKKLVIIILAIFGVFLCVCITCIVSFNLLFNKVKDSAKDMEDSIVNETMENNVENVIEKEEGGDMDVELNDLAEGFPDDVSIYPNSEVISSFSGLSGYNATFTVDDVNLDDVVEFYKKELKKEGWELTDVNDYFGFTLSATKDTREVVITIVDDSDGSVSYSIIVESQEE